MFYTDVAQKLLIFHLQAGCTGRHAFDLLVLHKEMQRYHIEVERIPEYINMLKDAHEQARRAGWTTANKTLLLFASTAMLKTEQYPWTNNDWEDRTKEQKTCADWKTSYKRSHAKARIKAKATEASDKFGVANINERVLKDR